MRALLSTLILPMTIFFLLFTSAIFLSLFRNQKSARILIAVSFCWFLLISTPFFPRFLIVSLENKYPSLLHPLANTRIGESEQHPVNILVLGAGNTFDKNLPPNDQLSAEALVRLVEGIRLFRMLPGSTLYVSGAAVTQPLSQARIFQKTAVSLGVPFNRIIRLDSTLNTKGEAESYVKKAGTKAPLILVTDAAHMPRAMLLFRNAGIHPIPAPASHFIKYSIVERPPYLLPSSGNIAMMEYAAHEYVGMVWSYVEK